MRILSILICLGGLFLAVLGGWLAYDQHVKVTTWPAMPATIIDSHVEVRKGSKGGRTYIPVISYRYTVDGRGFAARRVFPFGQSAGQSRSAQLIAMYGPGASVTAYVDPAPPHEAYLVRESSITPHILLLAGLVGLGLGAWLPGLTRKPDPRPEPSSGGWYRLSSGATVGQRAWRWLIAGVGWEAMVGVSLGTFFLVAMRPLATEQIVVGWLMTGLGIIPLLAAAYYGMMGASFGDAAVQIDRERLTIGEQVRVRVEQLASRSMHVDELAVGLICKKTTVTKTGGKSRTNVTTAFEKWWPLVSDKQTMAGDALSGSTTMLIPPTERPATPPDQAKGSNPRFAWHLAVRTSAHGRPNYRGKFLVEVVAPRGEA